MPLRPPRRSGGRRPPAPARLQEYVRVLCVIQRLILRNMNRLGLSLRGAARDGRIPVGTLSFLLDTSRVTDPDKQPKRRCHRGTLLHLRAMPWIRPLTARTLDRLLATGDRRVGL